jgi:hypothetical protein
VATGHPVLGGHPGLPVHGFWGPDYRQHTLYFSDQNQPQKPLKHCSIRDKAEFRSVA